MLDKDQQKAYYYMNNTNQSIFLTGNAGTGKSHVVNYFKENTHKKYIVLAPTGKAAINVGGQTIHSFFRIFKAGVLEPDSVIQWLRQNTQFSYRNMFKSIDTIIIDEVSMLRSDLMRTIDLVCRTFRNEPTKFMGGIQTIFVGDLSQLPPVADSEETKYLKDKYGGIYFFNAPDVQFNILPCILTKIHRQNDPKFIELLNNIRNGVNLDYTLQELNKRVLPPPTDKQLMVIGSTNKYVDDYNQKMMDSLPGKLEVYQGLIEGDYPSKSLPNTEVLRLKVGAQVVMLTNDLNSMDPYYNGSLGTYLGTDGFALKVKIGDATHLITPHIWKIVKYKYSHGELNPEEVSRFTQFPVRPAWAVTIHKSQGETYDIAYIQADRSFAHGQVYVALSRCRSLDNLYLARPLKESDIIIDSTVTKFMKDLLERNVLND